MLSVFENPWMLLALSAAAIPVIIELLFRRRRRRIELPSIRYLLAEAPQKRIKRQDRLLLLVRCTVPVLLAAALARPVLAPRSGRAGRERRVVLLIDRTLSMGQQVGVSTAFALAKNKAARLIKALPAGTKVTVATLGDRPELQLSRTTDLYAAGELVAGLKLSHGAAAMAEALPQAAKWLDADQKADRKRELFVFSDFQKTTWLRRSGQEADPVEQVRRLAGVADVYLVDVGGERPFNYFLTDLSPAEPLLVAAGTARFAATVEARGVASTGDPRARLTFLVNGEKKHMREVSLKAGRAGASFDYRFPSAGEYLVEVAVEGDSHRVDNRRFYLASVPESLKVLILDEAAGGAAASPEARFLAAAISPLRRAGVDSSSVFTAKVVHPAEIVRENLSDYVAVALLGTERPSADLVAKLEPYVRDGGNALLFVNGRTNLWEYNRRLHRDGQGLLAGKLDRAVVPPAGEAPGLTAAAVAHPALAMADDEKAFPPGLVGQFVSLADEADLRGARVVARLTNGQPAILEKLVGRGRAITFCTSAGPPGNLMPASPAYPVLMQEMLRYLAGDPDRAVNLDIGETFRQEVMVSSRHLIVRTPDNTKVRLRPVKSAGSGRLAVSFSQTDRMGQYTIDAQAGVLKHRRFVVNLKPVEGDLDRLSADEAEGMFGGAAAWVRPATPIEAVVEGKYTVVALAGHLLCLLAAVLALEMLLAVRFGSRRR